MIGSVEETNVIGKETATKLSDVLITRRESEPRSPILILQTK